MKRAIIITITLLLSSLVVGQDINKTFETRAIQELKIHSDYPNLNIVYSNNDNLKIVGNASFNDESVPESVSFEWDQTRGVLQIICDVDEFQERSAKSYKESKKKKEYKESWKNGNYKYKYWDYDVSLDVYIPESVKSIDIKATYGSIVMDELADESNLFSTYGSIEAGAENNLENCSLTATYSSVTLEMPEKLDTDIELRSDYGDIYSDIDFDIDRDKSVNKMYKTIIRGYLNSPGKHNVSLRADYGNIYLKKS